MGGGGALLWFTAVTRKRATCMSDRRKRLTGGSHTRGLRSGGCPTLVACVEEHGPNRCSGRAAVAEVAGQLHCPVIIRRCRRVQQSQGPALLKFSSLHPVLKHGSRSLAV